MWSEEFVHLKILYTGEMQALPYLFAPIDPLSKLFDEYIKSPYLVTL
ncbi:hypothetical protein HYD98_01080 [Mycoplasmopsis bovis]|nr:hypothetical protein [Mycoplasmopsis bovis]QQH29191.1 hypothetical protein HYD98_01080 [Mycoplasmopsis bovis]